MTRIRPFLMFQGGVGAAAIELYTSVFAGAEVIASTPHDDPSLGIQLAELDLAGQRILVSDSAIPHAFDFTPSTSLFVDCADRAELEHLVQALAADGSTLMPLGEYGFSTAFAWVADRFGVSWQLNLP
ncbi:VOC family protein [Rhodococcus sp. D2-41]|uniref:VOC family protein n=1 Tax=Speluncibacter jeojiensis TaxID=2710754 RepID=A0A9X4RBN0_9ACTN|nr:VOC family protein [Rhodococcus sp. D2-41]MDG3008839.1 VOC family protein [Rhodococcus sp. D2-41]MDG3012950.1 VOC family protein [Corynebacteriales bacterium D3-21]